MKRCIDHYQLEQKIGRGGMSLVYKARDLTRNRECALKLMLGKTSVRRFKREFRALSRLHHPNIVEVYEFGVVGSRAYFTMEYVDGCNLREAFNSDHGSEQFKGVDTPTKLVKVLTTALAICESLDYIHGLSIIHRDLKPGNIMLNPDGLVKLMDFGLAKELDLKLDVSITQSGVFMGTVSYMAPEQAMGKPVDQRADLYSLGIILYELLAGRLPFIGANLMAIVVQHLRDTPTPLRVINPYIPPAIEVIVQKLLEKEPINRYRTALEVRADLQQFLNQYHPAVLDSGRVFTQSSTMVAPSLEFKPKVMVPEFVGRAAELEFLEAYLRRCLNGIASLVLLGGESGIGKSRLLDEFADSIKVQHVRLVRGSCQEIERFPYQAFHGLFQFTLQRCQQNGQDYTATLLGPASKVLESLYPMFGELPAVQEQPTLVVLEPHQSKLRIFDAIFKLLTRLSQESPLVLFIDDLQWADELSLEMLEYLFRNLTVTEPKTVATVPTPVLIIGTYRDEDVKAGHGLVDFMRRLGRNEGYGQISLARLDKPDILRIINSLTGRQDWDPKFFEQIYQESEGNPFFVMEIVKALIEEGVISIGPDGWKVAKLDLEESVFVTKQDTGRSQLMTIPRSIADLISRRLDKIPEHDKKILTLAAVIGSSFHFEVLHAVAEVSEEQLLDVLDNLLKQRLLEEVKGAEDLFKFQHEMIRRLLYHDISLRRRRIMHKKVAASMESLFAHNLQERCDILAYHYYQAGENLAALRYLEMAALKALREYRNEDALNLAKLGHDLSVRVDYSANPQLQWQQQNALLTIQVQVLTLVGRLHEAKTLVERQLELARNLGDPRELVKILYAQSLIEQKLGDLLASQTILQQALALVRQHGLGTEELLVLNGLGTLYRMTNQMDLAITTSESVVARAQGKEHRGQRTAALINLGVIFYTLGDYERSLATYHQSLSIVTQSTDKASQLICMNNIGGVYHCRGDHDQAITWYKQALELAEAIGARENSAAIRSNLGVIYHERGDFRQAASCHQMALAICAELDDRIGKAYGLLNLASTRQMEGDFVTVLSLYEESLNISKELGDQVLSAYAYFLIGQNFFLQSNRDTALVFFDQALNLAHEISLRRLVALIHTFLGFLKTELGQPEEGRRLCEQSLQEGHSLSDLEVIVIATIHLARVQLLTNDTAKLADMLQALLPNLEKNGYRPYLYRALHLLGQTYYRNHDLDEAKNALQQAITIVTSLYQQVEEQYREAFLDRRDVKELIEDGVAVLTELGERHEAESLRRLWR